MLERVLPYLKASVSDDHGPAIELSADDSPVLRPYVGTMLISYVVDEDTSLRLVTEGELRASGVPERELLRAALANLAPPEQERGRRSPRGALRPGRR